VDVIAATAREHNLEVLEGEVVAEKIKEAIERLLAGREHRLVAVVGRRPGEVVGVEVEDEVRALPAFRVHRLFARGVVLASREVDVPWTLAREKVLDVSQVEQGVVPDVRLAGPLCPGNVSPLARARCRWLFDSTRAVVVTKPTPKIRERPLVHVTSFSERHNRGFDTPIAYPASRHSQSLGLPYTAVPGRQVLTVDVG
jgi:hypothetical protein